jgi:carbonic anhydrase/acetyltransferase-like protein (isoleucine patch superfamily)
MTEASTCATLVSAAMPTSSFRNLVPHVHVTALVHPSAELIGEVDLGEYVSVWPACVLRGDRGAIVVGARTNLQDGTVAHATGGLSTTRIGRDCTVGHRAILHGCAVGDWCLVGMGAIIMDNAAVGEWSFVAAGALLPPGRAYQPRSFIMGVPARRVRDVTDAEVEVIRRSRQSYLDLAAEYAATGGASERHRAPGMP